MRKYDYEVLTQALKEAYPMNSLQIGTQPFSGELSVARVGWLRTVETVADHLELAFKSFDRERFMKDTGANRE